ncbi:MAG: two-component sensor histidine kinase [Proteobacteria bacterium]|nr:two-component sensor histidine kinase [Pseudomonadota bacterium]
MDSSRYYHHLRRWLVGIIILVSVTPLLAISAIAGYQFRTAYRYKVLAHLSQVVDKHRANIDTFLNEKLADIQVLAETQGIPRLSDEAVLAELLHVLQSEHRGVFADLGLVDDQGVQVAYAGPFKLAQAVYGDAAWFKEAMESRFYISDVFLGLRGLPHFIVAVKKHWAGREWILRSTIDFMAFNELVENLRIGRTGLAFIINREGAFQTRPPAEMGEDAKLLTEWVWGNEVRGGKEILVPKTLAVEAWSPFNGAKPVVQSPPRVFSFTSQTLGGRALFVTAQLKEGDWALVVQQQKSDAYAIWYRTRNVSIAVLLLGSVAIVITSMFLARRTVQRISQSDTEKEMMTDRVIQAGKLASLGELAAGIAHEINNPVAIMVEESGWVEDLLEEPEFSGLRNVAEIRRALAQIKVQGVRCREITYKLLSFARKTDPTEKTVQLNDLVNEVAGLSEQRARFANVRVEKDLAGDLPLVRVSPSEMQQVILNLLNNAIDAIDPKAGGTVRIATRATEEGVVLDVSDTGQGIPEANLARIFDPFFTTKPVGKGTGLGLSICYGIIQKMSGKISVQSAVDAGTTFHITIPVAPGSPKGPPTA